MFCDFSSVELKAIYSHTCVLTMDNSSLVIFFKYKQHLNSQKKSEF